MVSSRLSRAASTSLSSGMVIVGFVLLSAFVGSESIITKSAEAPPCEEIYVVKDGETLHTISAKCGDPYILEQNPHINDFDDVFPGLVLKITPATLVTGH